MPVAVKFRETSAQENARRRYLALKGDGNEVDFLGYL
jgi:hypothetical protein